jgi:O-antigen/teichoic acid export membrane protein
MSAQFGGYGFLVTRLRHLLIGSPGRLFVSTRGFTSGLALVLALYYTKLLGVDKRSILVFIMVSALILTVILTSGISLTLRNRPTGSITSSDLVSFLFVVCVSGVLVGVFNTLLLTYYSGIRSDLTSAIYIICFIYSFFACINLGFQDALVARGNLKLAAFFDLITILVQGLSLLFFVYLDQTSLFMSVMISFVFSYLLISFATLSVFVQTESINFHKLLTNAKQLIKSSTNNQLFGIANGLADRIDRFLIALLMPLSLLSKYALITSIISFTRFFPEAYNRILLLKYHSTESGQKRTFGVTGLFLISCGVIGFVLSAQVFIEFIFGNEWVLPVEVGALFAVQEILRGYYQSSAIKLVSLGGSSFISRISLLLILCAVTLMVLLINQFGLIGAPISMILIYILLTYLVFNKIKASTR